LKNHLDLFYELINEISSSGDSFRILKSYDKNNLLLFFILLESVVMMHYGMQEKRVLATALVGWQWAQRN
jgi:hypothetical protein